eukprot:7757242-Ditylum_brightwellii.AAC.1
MDKERPVVEKMEIVPAVSIYDECALQCGISDINCTSKGEPARHCHCLHVCHQIGNSVKKKHA